MGLALSEQKAPHRGPLSPAPRATAIARRGGSDILPRVSGGDFAAARRLLFSGSRRGRLILVSGLDGPFIFTF